MNKPVLSNAYDGQQPWNPLGVTLPPNQSIEAWIKHSGMEWEINESPVHFKLNGTNDFRPYEDKKILYRNDTGAPLSVVSERYKVVQPREILEFYRDLIEVSGYELQSAGVIKGGKKIWAMARTGQETMLKGNDHVKSYLIFASACDGSLASTVTPTSIRVVCSNTLAYAINGAANAIKVPHSTQFNAQAVKKELGISVSQWDNFIYQLKHLSERKVKPQESVEFFNQVFNSESESLKTKQNDRTIKIVQSLFEGKGKGSLLESSAGKAWGLLNAVTEYIDHEKRARNVDYRVDNALFGRGAQIKQRALQVALDMVI